MGVSDAMMRVGLFGPRAIPDILREALPAPWTGVLQWHFDSLQSIPDHQPGISFHTSYVLDHPELAFARKD